MSAFFSKKNNDHTAQGVKGLVQTIHDKTGYISSLEKLLKTEEYKTLKACDDDEKKESIVQFVNHYTEVILERATLTESTRYDATDYLSYAPNTLVALISALLSKDLNYNEREWIELFKQYELLIEERKKISGGYFSICQLPINNSIKQIEYYVKDTQLSPKLKSFINKVRQWDIYVDKETGSSISRELGLAQKQLTKLVKDVNEKQGFLMEQDIGAEINKIISEIKNAKTANHKIFHLASTVKGSRPDEKFTENLNDQLELVGLDNYRKTVHKLLSVPLSQQFTTITHQYEHHEYTETKFLSGENQTFIKGIVWTCSRFSDKETISILTQLTEKCFSKIPNKGPAAAAAGNACVYILGNMKGKDGLGALARLKLKIRQNNVKKAIDKLLAAGAEKYNISVEELKEMAVPDFGLVSGLKQIKFKDYTFVIDISGSKVTNNWLKPDGTPMKSVPSKVKQAPALTKKLKEVRKEIKEIQKVYTAQKQRIDNQFILSRKWDYTTFEKYYLNHGLVSPLTSKLIWTFSSDKKTDSAILINGDWRTIDNTVIDWIDDQTIISLWHPIDATEANIVAWRQKIVDLEITQPIKQAYREIYIITDAELNTETYSNRMSAHILKQHQFSTLASIRNWKYSLMGGYDDGIHNQVCSKHLQKYQLTAEFWIDELNQNEESSDAGIWYYVSTDQVKFTNRYDETVNLAEVPRIVFTEVMRDVDLFVGVSSVGNDPQWIDNNGDRQNNREYWFSYSFGDLTEITKTRKLILEGLLPRLTKIRDIAEIKGKYLILHGKLRTYKIHIGSGNILMEPDDQYLCIVPARSDKVTQKLFIPFEGDRGLSIVLSKALLLADDDKIVDPVIVRQIQRN